jgi:hypothetical protein
VDDNDFLVLEEPLSPAEVNAFRKASLAVRDAYLRLGGPGGRDLLERILALSAEARRNADGSDRGLIRAGR